MRNLICSVLLLSLISASFAAVSIGSFQDPRHPGKCTISKDLILSPGEIKDPTTDCGRIICTSDGWAEFHSCGVQILSMEGFKYGDYEDISLPYPDCCKRKIVRA